MFVLIWEIQFVINRFRLSFTNIKRIVNFFYSYLRLWTYLYHKQRKPTITREHFGFLFVVFSEIVQISGTKRKAKTLYVNML